MTNKSDKILAPIKGRIIKLIENQGEKKEYFFKKIKVASSNFRGNALFSEISAEIVAKILSEFPDISAEWLLTGKGSMLKEPTQPTPVQEAQPANNDNEIIALLKAQLKDKEEKEALLKEKIKDLEEKLKLAELKNKEAMSAKIEIQRAKLQAKEALLSEKDEIILSQTGTISQLNEEINSMKSTHQPATRKQSQPPKGL